MSLATESDRPLAPAKRSSEAPPSSLAHVATISFLAARAAPPIGFPLALAGGAALARGAERHPLRPAYGAAAGAVIETAAIVGPSRLGGPLTQAATAPLLGRLEASGTPAPLQIAVCASIRLLYTASTSAFFIWVIAGGIDAYAGAYDALLGFLPWLPEGRTAALVVTLIALAAWAVFAASAQVYVYRRAMRRWPDASERIGPDHAPPPLAAARRFDPRAVAVAAMIAFGLLLASTEWPPLGAVAAWLALGWLLSAPDRDVVPAGLVLALILGLSGFLITLAGGDGLDESLQRAVRAALLVLTATWLRGAAGAHGFREVAARALWRLRRIPVFVEAAGVLSDLGTERRLGASARAMLRAVRAGGRRPIRVVDAVLDWVAAESDRFRAPPPAPRLALTLALTDLALVISATLPSIALVAL